MSAPRLSRRLSRQIVATSPVYSTVLVLPWTLIYGESKIRSMLELRSIIGSFAARVGFRTASVRTDAPDAWSSVDGAVRSTNGAFVQDLDVSSVKDKLWMQFRVAAATTRAEPAEAWARYRIETRRSAVLLATRAIEVEHASGSSDDVYVPIGKITGALGMSGLMFAFVYTGASGGLTYGPAVRTFDVDNMSPSPWRDMASYSEIDADEMRNSGHLPVDAGAKGFVQPGVRIRAKGARGTLRVLVAARYE